MGYYSHFREVIPLNRAGYPRVTERYAEARPLDSHGLIELQKQSPPAGSTGFLEKSLILRSRYYWSLGLTCLFCILTRLHLNLKKTCFYSLCTHHNVYRCTILITSQPPARLGTARPSAASYRMGSFIARMLWSQRRGLTQRPADRPLLYERDELAKPVKRVTAPHSAPKNSRRTGCISIACSFWICS